MGFVCDLIYRFGFFVFTIVLLVWLDSPGVDHCTNTQPDPFAKEATWMKYMAHATLAWLIVHFIWRYFARIKKLEK